MVRAIKWMAAAAVLVMAASAPAQRKAAADDKDKLICKRDTETGSLVAKKRQCHTRKDWDRIAEAARMNGQYEMDRSMAKPGGQ